MTQSKPHRRSVWRKPAGGKAKRPPFVEAARAALVRGIKPAEKNPADRGWLYQRLSRLVVVAGYTGQRILHRMRAWRGDGADSVLAVLVALLYSSDLRSGLVGKPRKGGGPWERFSVRDLAQFALGAQDRAAIATTERALRVLAHAGLVRTCTQMRRSSDAGEVRSDAAVRRLNYQRLADLLGLGWLLARDRAELDRRHGPGLADQLPAKRAAAAQDSRVGDRQRRLLPEHALFSAVGVWPPD